MASCFMRPCSPVRKPRPFSAVAPRSAQALWDSQVQALLRTAFERVGVSVAPSWRDWVWSHVVVWSRLLEWPAPSTDGAADAGMQEGLLPFIDFCNHGEGTQGGPAVGPGCSLAATLEGQQL